MLVHGPQLLDCHEIKHCVVVLLAEVDRQAFGAERIPIRPLDAARRREATEEQVLVVLQIPCRPGSARGCEQQAVLHVVGG
eukprot:549342-Pyramimonas_sp.AAC.1